MATIDPTSWPYVQGHRDAKNGSDYDNPYDMWHQMDSYNNYRAGYDSVKEEPAMEQKFRKIGDLVKVWNGFEDRFNDGHITSIGGHGCTMYQVLQYNEAKSQWWHHEDNVLDRED